MVITTNAKNAVLMYSRCSTAISTTKMAPQLAAEDDWRKSFLCTVSQVHTYVLGLSSQCNCQTCTIWTMAHCRRIGASAFQEGTYLLCLKLASTGYPFDLYVSDIYICQEAQNRFEIICSLLTNQAIFVALCLPSMSQWVLQPSLSSTILLGEQYNSSGSCRPKLLWQTHQKCKCLLHSESYLRNASEWVPLPN